METETLREQLERARTDVLQSPTPLMTPAGAASARSVSRRHKSTGTERRDVSASALSEFKDASADEYKEQLLEKHEQLLEKHEQLQQQLNINEMLRAKLDASHAEAQSLRQQLDRARAARARASRR